MSTNVRTISIAVHSHNWHREGIFEHFVCLNSELHLSTVFDDDVTRGVKLNFNICNETRGIHHMYNVCK